jgi:hypothetical protein
VAASDLAPVAEHLFVDFMAPLVLGGALSPGRPIGARAALAFGPDRAPVDFDRLAHVQLARVRCARRLYPIDRLAGPTAAEWALAAALHDLIQSAHPSLAGPFRRNAPSKLASLAEATVERVPAASTVADALSRHTWFARVLEIARTDTVVSWWVGKSVFLGAPAPARLTAWPELRRVHVDTTPRSLVELPSSGGAIDTARFTAALGQWLARTPLTDLAQCGRATPAFAWSADTLALVATRAGRTLALRAMGIAAEAAPTASIDRALGRATRRLFEARAWKALSPALDLLGERAIADAQSMEAHREPFARGGSDDVAFARGAGALVARRWIDSPEAQLSEPERRRLAAALDAARASAVAIEAVLAPLLGPT